MNAKLVVSVVVALSVFSGIAVAQNSDPVRKREQQWAIRDVNAAGQPRRTATFLADDLKTVIFEASCPEKGRLDLRYYAEPDLDTKKMPDVKQMGFARHGVSVSSPAAVDGAPERFLVSFAIDDKLLSILKPDGSEMTIDAINITDDPWFVGDAAPLHQLATACKEGAGRQRSID
ncbi:hypothetical protein [Reyranella sp. CPCC 100927]|uniref:hypothetical protein n=1 Tax=Reyranella sp. CPCC 100927 TaxID=2599616 RepID=UPI0011B76A27|nr:hypothetical protein [Reyranella sp. CPCC 100927]TWT10556.1 hypothetical protein FQU96_15660 [Reyranella sp. CPCC 100927]